MEKVFKFCIDTKLFKRQLESLKSSMDESIKNGVIDIDAIVEAVKSSTKIESEDKLVNRKPIPPKGRILKEWSYVGGVKNEH